MPYVDDKDRKHINDGIAYLAQFNGMDSCYDSPRLEDIAEIILTVPSGKTKGAFNYLVSRLWLNVFCPGGAVGYTSLSDAIAVFNDMEGEMRRRLMDPYEDICIEKNGDLDEFVKCLEWMG